MKLNDIKRPEGLQKAKPRKGRGQGTGNGKTAGRGHKGQRARSGSKIRPWFEGGQMPINRRLPKRGFTNHFRKVYEVVNLKDLGRVEGSEVDGNTLWQAGLVKSPESKVKLLADGGVDKAYTITVDRASKSAVEAITAAGGSVNTKGQ